MSEERCPGCGAYFAIVGRVHRCRGALVGAAVNEAQHGERAQGSDGAGPIDQRVVEAPAAVRQAGVLETAAPGRPRVVATGDRVEPPGYARSRHDPEKTRAYMRTYMRKRRAKA